MIEDLTGMFGKTIGNSCGVIFKNNLFVYQSKSIVIIFVLLAVFWLWMLIECLQNNFKKDMDKLIWVIILLVTNVIGAILYFFMIKYKPKNIDIINAK